MGEKKVAVIILLVVLFIGGIIIFDINKTENNLVLDRIESEILVRNISWNTPFLSDLYYKKGDEIEYLVILKSKNKKIIDLNIEKLKSKFEIKEIIKDDEKITDTNNLGLEGGNYVKIIGKAKDNGSSKNNNELINFVEDEKELEKIKKDETKTNENKEKPKIISGDQVQLNFNNYYINSNINNLIEITGVGLDFISNVNIGGVNFKIINDGNRNFISIDKNTFNTGDYFVILKLKNGEIKTLERKIFFEFSSQKVNIANITPKTIKVDNYIVIQGNGFSKIISIQLNNNIILKNTTFQIISDNVMVIKIPREISPGNYYLNVMDTDGIYEIKNKTFNITN